MDKRKIRYSVLDGRFAICRLAPNVDVPEWSLRAGFFSVTRTADELSLVCAEEHVPSGVPGEFGWSCLQLQGPFSFAMTGVLAAFISPLAETGVGIFAISTFDTDCVLIKTDRLLAATDALGRAGYTRAN